MEIPNRPAFSWRKSRAALLCLLCLLLLTATTVFAHGEKKEEKKGILLVAFGTSVPEAEVSFRNIEKKVHEAFPGIEVRWAYTSKIIRRKLAEQNGRAIDSPAEALARMMNDDFTQVAVQSLHTIPGEEYSELAQTVRAFSGLPKGMRSVTLGEPLLWATKDVENVAAAVMASLPPARKKDEAVVLMGHGTRHPANIYYPGIQFYFWKADPNILVGTVEGSPSIEDVVRELKQRNVKKAYLMPLMSVAGDHARNDMAGKDEQSWTSVLAKAGIEAVPVMKGTGETEALADIWISHLKEAFSRLTD